MNTTNDSLPPTPRSSASGFPLRLIFTIGCLALGASIAPAGEINIGVRTKVLDGWVHPKGKESADGGHSKVFGFLAVEEIKSDQRLVKPMDKEYLKGILLHELTANGFRPYTKGTNPDILLAVSFGRGELHNPYARDTGVVFNAVTDDKGKFVSVPTQSIVGDTQQLMDEVSPTYQAKLMKAVFEKLFIRVAAFEFPKTPNSKPKMLWKTTIVADDPDNQDLNAIAAVMLAAGAPLFDKETAEKEVDLYKPLPNSRVSVGTPEVVEQKK